MTEVWRCVCGGGERLKGGDGNSGSIGHQKRPKAMMRVGQQGCMPTNSSRWGGGGEKRGEFRRGRVAAMAAVGACEFLQSRRLVKLRTTPNVTDSYIGWCEGMFC